MPAAPSDWCPGPVHHAVSRWAADTPDRPAISCAGDTLSYRELDERANRLAHRLRELDVARGSVVALHLDRGLDHYVALLAVLKAGGTVLPLDTTYPVERLRYLLTDSGAGVLVTSGGLDTLEGTVTVRLDRDAGLVAGYPATPPPEDVRADDVAYVMYTSASTGQPKGVQLPHGGIAHLCGAHVEALGLTGADRGSLAAPLSFDAAILDLWPMLVVGARVVAIADDDRAEPPRLVAALRAADVTVCFLTTALAELLLVQPGIAELPLRYLVTGGEALRRRPRPGLPFRLINIYGPTETTVYVTSTVVDDDATGSGPIPIGHPLAGVGVHLLDKDERPVPEGEPGEIVVSGPGVARGYLGRPDLTAQRFRPDPAAPGATRYHTGDLARRRADGGFEFLGRLDRQVKVRGHRIEPEEIERTLLDHPGVTQAAVVAIRPPGEPAQLVAYAAADPAWRPDGGLDEAPVPPGTARATEVTLAQLTEAGAILEIGRGLAGIDRVAARHVRAGTVAEVKAEAEFDATVLDCRPGAYHCVDTLLDAIGEAVRATRDGGLVVASGVRSLPLLATGHAHRELAGAPDEMIVEELRWRVRSRVRADTGLAVHPSAFAALDTAPRVAAVDLTPTHREPGAPTFDVVVHVGPPAGRREVEWLDWSAGTDLRAIRALLQHGQRPVVAVRGIPMAAAAPADWASFATAGDLRHNTEPEAPTPLDLVGVAAGTPYRTRLSWRAGREDGSVDAAWVREPAPIAVVWPEPSGGPASARANQPGRPSIDRALRTELRAKLARRFVPHEMPDLILVLDRLPLTPVGKVDRAALPPPSWLATGSPTEPRTPAEAAVHPLVVEVLGHPDIGLDDDIRTYGAHSLTMAQLTARIAGRFGVGVRVRELLAEPTVAAIAVRVADAIETDLGAHQEVA
ncbi:amino acid adenylation domain-containing protein [Amycolatopsis sp., V23-08]|uniref:Amino acid adenylation domain-containing protein n=1 Tax=Amycolatopsis heterodermiae TaxID=3110235 RepID=A0ABU5R251_9PSEU|nr:amino acid adenylation domain-containing protein [Amycolatopsis sp., V23-08]MEA5360286.1 amino acid adenylation domain-containing protein [Amycolatopsis sp., V23-08]